MSNRIDIHVYYLSSPPDQVGMPSTPRWALAVNGSFKDAYRTRRDAIREAYARIPSGDVLKSFKITGRSEQTTTRP